MTKVRRLIVAAIVSTVAVLGMPLGIAADSGMALQADVTELGGSGITGHATVEISAEGLRGVLKASNFLADHGYTVWIFYIKGTGVGGPGRFDSNVASDSGELTFHGHVGGLQVASGATIRLLIFHHPDLTALPSSGCVAKPPSTVARANNLLTPACGSPVAIAEFVIP